MNVGLMVALKLLPGAGEVVTEAAIRRASGYRFLLDFHKRKDVDAQERARVLEAAEVRAQADKETAKLLHEGKTRKAREQEIAKLQLIIANTAQAIIDARTNKDHSAIVALEKKLDRKIDEEELLLLTLLL